MEQIIKKMNKGITYLLICTMVIPFMISNSTKAAESDVKVIGDYDFILDNIYPVDFDTKGVVYGYYKGKVVLMNGATGKLIKTTEFTDINEIKPNKYNDNVDAIVTMQKDNMVYFGLMDKEGNTLIQPNKYTQIFYDDRNFSAVDAKGNTYYISRTGKVLYTFKKDDIEKGYIIEEYEKFFLVYKPNYAKGQNRFTNPVSVSVKGVFDYEGNPVRHIQNAYKTATNQYWLLYNKQIKEMKSRVKNEVRKEVIAKYRDKIDIATYLTPIGNCYVIDADGYINNPDGTAKYSINRSYLFDINGKVIDKADHSVIVSSSDYVVLQNGELKNDNFIAKNATLYNTKSYQKYNNKDLKEAGPNMRKFKDCIYGEYFLSGYDEEDIVVTGIYDTKGNLVKRYQGLYFDYYTLLSDVNEQKSKELKEAGKPYYCLETQSFRIGDGQIALKSLDQNNSRITFFDDSLNEILKIDLDKDTEAIHFYEYKILTNNAGIYVRYLLDGIYTETVYNRLGKVIYTYRDTNSDKNVYNQSNGATNYIGCIKYTNIINIGSVVFTSAENTGEGEVTLTWKPVKGAEGYDLRAESIGPDCDTADEYTKGNSIVFTGLKKGKTYKFYARVRSFDKSSRYGKPITVKVDK
ncbi:fibronectin type III domain-containing protein [Anaeromicropila herbilytica]|uniref:Fibronectin type-III domain-containing protein n=1 Tax=Anaeromicropila herbilytica TaxID=2785025 RepID=A0A7R7IEF3_9FIRM|nr:fibronectin type III domain-containing protein [Anaeromicropila herbilytica]BCN31043.1 hypothetical protein bsdtb5_23380 [Anaeromicropila herbilytica]